MGQWANFASQAKPRRKDKSGNNLVAPKGANPDFSPFPVFLVPRLDLFLVLTVWPSSVRGKKKYRLCLDQPWYSLITQQEFFNAQVWPILIDNNYARIFVLYYLFIDHGIFGSYIQNSMLYFLKYNSALIYKEQKENTSNNYLSIFGNFHYFSHCIIQWSYRRHPM